MNNSTQHKSRLAIAVVVVLGALLGWAILQKDKPQASDEHGHAEHAEAQGHADDEHHGGGATKPHADAKEHGDEEHHEEAAQAKPAKGPHGGRIFSAGSFGLEVTIFEDGVPPEFRLYPTLNGKPLPPAQASVKLTLERLGRAPEVIQFKPKGDFLRGDAEVVEPHSFKVAIEATQGGQTHRFGYEQEEARVTMSDAQLQQAGVTLAVAGPARINSQLALLGEVRYNGDRTVQVVPRLAGLVEAVPVSAGDRVRKGQVLAVLSSPALADQRAEGVAAQKRLALARSTFEREQKLWQDKISAEQDYQQARAALQEAEIAEQNIRQKLANLGATATGSGNLTRFELRSPIDGIVTDKRITVGQSLGETEPVFTISDLSSVWVEAPVATKDLGDIRSGLTVQVKASGFDTQAAGTITYVSALVGEQTRSATARVVLPNPKGLWRPGLPVRVEVTSGEAEVPVAVQADAIQSVRDWQVVFGRYGQQLEARPLQLGRSDGRVVEVLSGLNAGERYAAKNSFVIKADLGKAGASHEH
ncbi:MAG: efflux RND transporter periplasmic adaptor subunit [Aquabacterium sp.]|uniref:efflux RND transporter periplasmic adaptor subunit n=1 Tax=Aquabacterium sp. TaxID=1872578 RepID=UPI0025C28382|nr:efflux RND transporter periplasmic adaptor subunit [Aquabacterium sp.]MBI5926464.1 efflux RND transporter periplasmic adaptor subunit [Aquabacterium sp.]